MLGRINKVPQEDCMSETGYQPKRRRLQARQLITYGNNSSITERHSSMYVGDPWERQRSIPLLPLPTDREHYVSVDPSNGARSFPDIDRSPLLISEEIFRENISDLLNGIEASSRHSSPWTQHDSNFYFNKVHCFTESYKRQLLKEREKLDEELRFTKVKFMDKYQLVTQQVKMLVGVLDDYETCMKFSIPQKTAIQSAVQELNMIKNSLNISSNQSIVPQEAFLKKRLEEKDKELAQAKKQVDKHFSDLKSVRGSLKKAETKLKNLQINTQSKVIVKSSSDETEVEVLEKLASHYKKEFMSSQRNLGVIQDRLNSLILGSAKKTQDERKEIQANLSEIRSMLSAHLKTPELALTVGNNVNDEKEEMFKDIKLLIQEINNRSEKDITGHDTADSSTSLKFNEYEIHLVTLIASFLKVTPFPVSTDFIFSYVKNVDNTVEVHFIESLLKRFPSFFKEVAAASASASKTWVYSELKPIITLQ